VPASSAIARTGQKGVRILYRSPLSISVKGPDTFSLPRTGPEGRSDPGGRLGDRAAGVSSSASPTGVACRSARPRPAAPLSVEARTIFCSTSSGFMSSENCPHCHAQWEYACRANAQSLFAWGSELPSEDALAKWMSLDFATGYQERLRSNAFGLYGLFGGEWCRDEYRFNYSPGAQVQRDLHVVRGGASMFWPWQDQEWVWCMSAMRMPESDLFADRRAGFRLAYEFGSKH
jgi:Sulfatase-modifying factor enzyme 1